MPAATHTNHRPLPIPDPATVHSHIGYLLRELRIARRLFKLACAARENARPSDKSNREAVTHG